MRVLIADDDPTCREIVRHMLTHAGHSVTAVVDGEAARDAILGQRFDMALLDLQMPQLGGAEVAQAVRAALPAHSLPRLVVLTAAAVPGAERLLLALGFDACLGKPVRPSTLLAELRVQAGPSAAPYCASPARRPSQPQELDAHPWVTLPDQASDEQVRAFAREVKAVALVAEDPQLAGLCARLEAAAAAGERGQVAELLAAIAPLMPS